jgi:hypothetical protein
MREYGFLNHDRRNPDSPPCFIDASASGFIRSLRVVIGLPPSTRRLWNEPRRLAVENLRGCWDKLDPDYSVLVKVERC